MLIRATIILSVPDDYSEGDVRDELENALQYRSNMDLEDIEKYEDVDENDA